MASKDPERHRDLSSKGGKSAHQKGTAHEWDDEEAKNAGHAGGVATANKMKTKGSPAGLENGKEEALPVEESR